MTIVSIFLRRIPFDILREIFLSWLSLSDIRLFDCSITNHVIRKEWKKLYRQLIPNGYCFKTIFHMTMKNTIAKGSIEFWENVVKIHLIDNWTEGVSEPTSSQMSENWRNNNCNDIASPSIFSMLRDRCFEFKLYFIFIDSYYVKQEAYVTFEEFHTFYKLFPFRAEDILDRQHPLKDILATNPAPLDSLFAPRLGAKKENNMIRINFLNILDNKLSRYPKTYYIPFSCYLYDFLSRFQKNLHQYYEVFVKVYDQLVHLLIYGIIPINNDDFYVYHSDIKPSQILIEEEFSPDIYKYRPQSMSDEPRSWSLKLLLWETAVCHNKECDAIPRNWIDVPLTWNKPFSIILFSTDFEKCYIKFLKENGYISSSSSLSSSSDSIVLSKEELIPFLTNFIWNSIDSSALFKESFQYLCQKLFAFFQSSKIIFEYCPFLVPCDLSQYSSSFEENIVIPIIVHHLSEILISFTVMNEKRNGLDFTKFLDTIFLRIIDIWGWLSIFHPFIEQLSNRYQDLLPHEKDIYEFFIYLHFHYLYSPKDYTKPLHYFKFVDDLLLLQKKFVNLYHYEKNKNIFSLSIPTKFMELIDGRLLTISQRENTISIWGLEKKEGEKDEWNIFEFTLCGHIDRIHCILQLHSMNENILSLSQSGCMKFWDLSLDQSIATIQFDSDLIIHSMLELFEANELATACHNSLIVIWNLQDLFASIQDLKGKEECVSLNSTLVRKRIFHGHDDAVTCLIRLLDGRLVSGSVDKSIKLWDVTTETCEITIREHEKGIRSLTLLKDGRFVSFDGIHIKVWNLVNEGVSVTSSSSSSSSFPSPSCFCTFFPFTKKFYDDPNEEEEDEEEEEEEYEEEEEDDNNEFQSTPFRDYFASSFPRKNQFQEDEHLSIVSLSETQFLAANRIHCHLAQIPLSLSTSSEVVEEEDNDDNHNERIRGYSFSFYRLFCAEQPVSYLYSSNGHLMVYYHLEEKIRMHPNISIRFGEDYYPSVWMHSLNYLNQEDFVNYYQQNNYRIDRERSLVRRPVSSFLEYSYPGKDPLESSSSYLLACQKFDTQIAQWKKNDSNHHHQQQLVMSESIGIDIPRHQIHYLKEITINEKQFLLTGDHLGILKLWQYSSIDSTFHCIRSKYAHMGGFHSIHINPSHSLVFTVGIKDRTIKAWPINSLISSDSGNVLYVIIPSSLSLDPLDLKGLDPDDYRRHDFLKTSFSNSIVFLSDERRIAFLTMDDISIWKYQLEPNPDCFYTIDRNEIHPNADDLEDCSDLPECVPLKGRFHDDTVLIELPGNDYFVDAINNNNNDEDVDGRRMIVSASGRESTIFGWDSITGELLCTWKGHSAGITCLLFLSMDSRLSAPATTTTAATTASSRMKRTRTFLSASRDHSLRIWQVNPAGTAGCCLRTISLWELMNNLEFRYNLQDEDQQQIVTRERNSINNIHLLKDDQVVIALSFGEIILLSPQ